jgi:protein-S-isoprenylcysteine O-methyltransferase
VDDRGTMRLLWITIGAALVAAILLQNVPGTRLPLARGARTAVALALLLGGLALRWAAIAALGRWFTTDVAVRPGQRVVTSGPYRRLRHPSYAGLMLAFLGLGVSFGSWLSLLVLTLPILLALVRRIRVEETVLRRELGDDYAAYAARTRRLVPGIW